MGSKVEEMKILKRALLVFASFVVAEFADPREYAYQRYTRRNQGRVPSHQNRRLRKRNDFSHLEMKNIIVDKSMTEKLREIDRLAKESMKRLPSQRESIEYLKSLKGRRFGGHRIELQGVNLNEKKSNSFLQNVLRRRALYRQRIIAQKCMEILKSGTHKGYTY